MTIVAARSVSSFFFEVVEDSIRLRGVEATDGATYYLVELLADYAHPDQRAGETLERPLTLLLDEAVKEPDPAERFERLRTIGDGVLYGCGFFGDHFDARGIDPKYLHGLGARAYGTASSMLRRGADGTSPARPGRGRNQDGTSPAPPGRGRKLEETGPDLFAELADNFAAFVAVVSDVADTTVAMSTETARGLLKVYERWLKTGSERLASALTSRGVMPTRGPKGVLQ
jgi:hypothetical protein